MTSSSLGWRVFTLADGGLLPPFAAHYWPGRGIGDPWTRGLNHARCVDDHEAPDPACTCGMRATVNLAALSALLSTRGLAGDAVSILQRCGVVARVELSGRILDGVDIPTTTHRPRCVPPVPASSRRTWPRSTAITPSRCRLSTASRLRCTTSTNGRPQSHP